MTKNRKITVFDVFLVLPEMSKLSLIGSRVDTKLGSNTASTVGPVPVQWGPVPVQWGPVPVQWGGGVPGPVPRCSHPPTTSPCRTYYPGTTTPSPGLHVPLAQSQRCVSTQSLVRQAALLIDTSPCSLFCFYEPLKSIKTRKYSFFTVLCPTLSNLNV